MCRWNFCRQLSKILPLSIYDIPQPLKIKLNESVTRPVGLQNRA
ncbi:MAG: hypothetical protein V7K55_14770 [Nostoc sp.]